MREPNIAERLKCVTIEGRKVYCINYYGLKEVDMIRLAIHAKDTLMTDASLKLVLNCFKNTFITPGYLRHMERETKGLEKIIERNALVGLNKPKMMILKGFNLLMGTDYRAFETEQEAVEYLLGEPITGEWEPIFANH